MCKGQASLHLACAAGCPCQTPATHRINEGRNGGDKAHSRTPQDDRIAVLDASSGRGKDFLKRGTATARKSLPKKFD
jgi:hypothetical protein